MNEEFEKKDIDQASDDELKAELEKREEKKWEKRGEDLEKRCDTAFAKLPRAINSLLDSLCLTLIIAGVSWGVMKIGWTAAMPTWRTFGFIFLVIFVISLLYRYFIKPKAGKCCCK